MLWGRFAVLFICLATAGTVLAQEPLRVVTLNLWHSSRELAERTHRTSMLLERLQPNLVGLQEVSGSMWRPNRARVLANRVDLNYAYRASDGIPIVFAEGLGILSTVSLNSVERRKLIHSKAWPFERRFLQWIEVTLPSGHEFILFNTHLTHHSEEGDDLLRLEQALEVMEIVVDTALERDIPAVLVGDLNSDPSDLAMHALTGCLLGNRSLFLDAWLQSGIGQGATYCPKNRYNRNSQKSRRLDYVLLLQGTSHVPMAKKTWRIADDKEEQHVSDHYGLAADLELVARESLKRNSNTEVNPHIPPAQMAVYFKERLRLIREEKNRAEQKALESGFAGNSAQIHVIEWLEAAYQLDAPGNGLASVPR